MIISLKLTRAENCAHFGVPAGTVIRLDLESEYLPACVASEVYENNSRTPIEAKKAQAIAARTYIAAHALNGTVIDDTANYQAFKYKPLESIPNSAKACRDTAGQVLVCDGKLITAWYSNSNGGRTKRSDEAWSSYKKWTVSKDDPWDVAGRQKWGEAKASHSVGMSQIGAAYAASIGHTYMDILMFYYVNSEVRSDYGRGEPAQNNGGNSMMKTNLTLVEHARKWQGHRYWYGTGVYKCTSSLLASKTKQYPAHYTEGRMARYKKDIADGMYCADCVGLIKGHYWDQDGKRVYDAKTDVSASGMYDRSPIKGLIKNLPEVPGLILYAPGHVGVYEGNGHVIEAKGFAHGIIRSKVSEGKWTHWCVCAYISYAGFEDKLLPTPITEPYTALVVTRSSPLNVWNDAKKTKSLLSVAKGDTILVLGYANAPGWFKVQKGAVKGVADSQYLQKVDMPTPQTDDDDAEVPIDHNHSGVLYQAKVVNVKTGLNLRLQPSQSGQTMLLIPLDAVVEVLQDNVADGFSYVCYGGVHGYCTRSYLYQMDSDMPAYYNILLRNATADVLARVLEICPAAEVTPVNG